MTMIDAQRLKRFRRRIEPYSFRSARGFVKLWFFGIVGMLHALLVITVIVGRVVKWSFILYYSWVVEQADSRSKTWVEILQTKPRIVDGE